MQITWLDLLAANIGAMLWLWALMAARRWWETEKSRFIPGFILVTLVAFGLGLFTYRASIWFDDTPVPIVPAAAVSQ